MKIIVILLIWCFTSKEYKTTLFFFSGWISHQSCLPLKIRRYIVNGSRWLSYWFFISITINSSNASFSIIMTMIAISCSVSLLLFWEVSVYIDIFSGNTRGFDVWHLLRSKGFDYEVVCCSSIVSIYRTLTCFFICALLLYFAGNLQLAKDIYLLIYQQERYGMGYLSSYLSEGKIWDGAWIPSR